MVKKAEKRTQAMSWKSKEKREISRVEWSRVVK